MPNQTAYGFVGLEYLFNERVREVGEDRIWTAITDSVAEYVRIVNDMLGLFVERTVVAQERYELPGSGTLQPLDEWGNPLPVVPAGFYTIGYPIQGGGTAWGDNRVSRALMSVQEANRFTLDALQRDMDWLYRHILAGIFTKESWTFTDKVGGTAGKGLGDITIYGLASGEANILYPRKGMNTPAADDHYFGTATPIDDANNPFTNLYEEILEHPSNADPVVMFASNTSMVPVKALAEFTPVTDPDVALGTGLTQLTNSGGGSLGPGEKVIGKLVDSHIWVVEWDSVPDNYYLVVGSGGGGPVLKMREYAATELQGFFPEVNSPDGNLQEYRLIRYAGFGSANRVKAAVLMTGGAAYVTPPAMKAPLGV